MRDSKLIRAAKTAYIAFSLFVCAVGAAVMTRPQMAAELVARLAGAALLGFGCVKLLGYFSRDLYRLAFQFDLAMGLLLMALGLAILLRPKLTMNALSMLMGVEIAADGLLKVQTSLDARRFGLATWWVMLLFAVAAGICGLWMILFPAAGTAVLARTLGLATLLEGALNLCVGLCAVKIVARRLDGEEMPER